MEHSSHQSTPVEVDFFVYDETEPMPSQNQYFPEVFPGVAPQFDGSGIAFF